MLKDKVYTEEKIIREPSLSVEGVHGRIGCLARLCTTPVGVFKKESVSNVERSAKPPPPVLDLLV